MSRLFGVSVDADLPPSFPAGLVEPRALVGRGLGVSGATGGLAATAAGAGSGSDLASALPAEEYAAPWPIELRLGRED